jgi:hypothetical protein
MHEDVTKMVEPIAQNFRYMSLLLWGLEHYIDGQKNAFKSSMQMCKSLTVYSATDKFV